jgi:hypothetical protein
MVIGCISCKNNQESGINEVLTKNNGGPVIKKKILNPVFGLS